jgi:AcrR family transcriptional regulator
LKNVSGKGGAATTDAGAEGETAARILAAAAAEFAERGFANARIRHIVDAAGANLAAVNYYFGGKEALYAATLRELLQRDPRVQVAARGCPEERLRLTVRTMLERYVGRGRPSTLSRILAHESMSPTPHFERLVEDLLRPEVDNLHGIVRAIVGPAIEDAAVMQLVTSVLGQCLIFLFARGPLARVHAVLLERPDACARLAGEIAEFSLAGIHRLRVPAGAPT